MKRKYVKSSKEMRVIATCCGEERETTINVFANSDTMSVYTADNTMLTKLKKILDVNPDTVKCWEAGRSEGQVTGYFFEMSKKHLSLRQSAGREMSEEERKAASERFKKLAAEGKLGRK